MVKPEYQGYDEYQEVVTVGSVSNGRPISIKDEPVSCILCISKMYSSSLICNADFDVWCRIYRGPREEMEDMICPSKSKMR